ncbi:Increased recombination centers protein 22 [Dimargaris cristalligena]|uniref:Translocon-associated protein subunit alpha n=1 Tax=Dimargaris cristalligena TaxID=215637 RepID=A0A4P9ZMX4_9FUNG|nr:Increased recombination centers protein 22 [Dimargaris cristalligena]RKP34647.1 hypothetical protein BJ085DRAFT_38689 [Dimargaris cristalligena]|eukprot:RKP34647.1 hypothetical protein BJ085DRAFT_38689 [Dimargaris cristalligena]
MFSSIASPRNLALCALILLVASPGSLATDETLIEPKVALTTTFSAKYPNTIVNSESNRVTISLTNEDEKLYIIDRIRAYLYPIYDHSKPLRTLEPARFTTKLFHNAQLDLPYRFTPLLDVGDTSLTLVVELSDKEGNTFKKVAFNETITVIDPSIVSFDPQLWSIYLMILGVLVGAGYWAKITYIDEKVKPIHPAIAKSMEANTNAEVDPDEWIADHLKADKSRKSRSGIKKKAA